MASIVNVTSANANKSYPINGEPVLARHILADFLEVAETDVETAIANKSVRIVNRGPLTDLNRQMKAGETVTIFEAEVAQGGVKAASEAFRS